MKTTLIPTTSQVIIRHFLPLTGDHHDKLNRLGITDEVMDGRGYTSREDTEEMRDIEAEFVRRSAFTGARANLPSGIFIRTLDVNNALTYPVFLPDLPRLDETGQPRRYELSTDSPPILDMHPFCKDRLSDQEKPFCYTSDIVLGDFLVSRGYVAFTLLNGSITNTAAKAAATFHLLRDWEDMLDGRAHHRKHYVFLDHDPACRLPQPAGHFDMLGAMVRALGDIGSDLVLIAPPLEPLSYRELVKRVMDTGC